MAAAPLEHAEQTRLALRTIVTEHGPEILSRPRVLSNLLADLLPDAPRIARILVAAAQDHISEELREHTSAGMDAATASRLAASTFADATLVPLDVCTWVVGEIALALGLVSDNSAPPISFSPSVTAVAAAEPVAAGPEKSTEPASTEPPAPAAPAGPGSLAARPDQAAVGRHRVSGQRQDPARAKPRGGGLDPHGRIKAPFPAGAGLAPGAGPGLGGPGADPAGPLAPADPNTPLASTAPADPTAPAQAAPAQAAPAHAAPAHAAPAQAVPATSASAKMTWTAVVTADREYFDGVIADGHVDVASIEFPSDYPERRIELTGTEMRIGRRSVSRKLEPEIDLAGPPTDPGVSHLHAVLIAAEDGTWSVEDRGSSNGTQVNGREIAEGERVPLRDGDRVCLGVWTALMIHSS
jgi:hypothetical protein